MRRGTAALVLGLAAQGCVVAVDDSFCVYEDVYAVVLELENGDVNVEVGDELCVDVGLGGAGSNGVGHHVDDGRLYLDYQCGGLCGGDITVRAPADLHVRTKLSAGDVSIDHREGDVVVLLGAGSISTMDLRSRRAELLTGAGDVSAEFAERPQLVEIAVATGSIDLELPQGGYALDLDADGGSIHLDGVFDDPGADAYIGAQVSAGSIDISGR